MFGGLRNIASSPVVAQRRRFKAAVAAHRFRNAGAGVFSAILLPAISGNPRRIARTLAHHLSPPARQPSPSRRAFYSWRYCYPSHIAIRPSDAAFRYLAVVRHDKDRSFFCSAGYSLGACADDCCVGPVEFSLSGLVHQLDLLGAMPSTVCEELFESSGRAAVFALICRMPPQSDLHTNRAPLTTVQISPLCCLPRDQACTTARKGHPP